MVTFDQLVPLEKLKDMSFGIETELVEKITVKPDWFLTLQYFVGLG